MTDETHNTARRHVLKAGLGLVAAGTMVASGARAQKLAQEKLAHELVQYQETPKDGNQCSKCAQFQAPNACAIVAGEIKPTGWCVAFAPKEG